MSIRAVIDTNVIVSGTLFGGIPLDVIHAAFAEKFTWVISQPLIEELKNVFSSKKFRLADSEIEAFTDPILSICDIVVPTETINVIQRCPKDNRVLECAVEGGCDYIVSGDRRDLVNLKSFRRALIITPREFVKCIP